MPRKPRSSAVTSVLDKGLGPTQAADLAAAFADWIDVVKLGWGSARLTDGDALRTKIRSYRDAGIRVCSGGTFLEIAVAQGVEDRFLDAARELDFDMVEVSNGIHPMPQERKLDLIRRACERGFTVWSEVGRKDADEDARLSPRERTSMALAELEAGSEKVVLEARESGTIGIYDAQGVPAAELVDRVAERVGVERLVFEAPRKAQQVWMIRHFGPEVNLGNIAADEVLAVASLRTGMRGDTFADFHLSGIDVYVERGTNGALEARERGGVVIVVDALRFSATVITALAAGMRSVKVVANPADCVGEVTAGERGGKKLAHVDLGNSPTELLARDVAGKELVLTTTNGAEMLLTVQGGAREVLVGSSLNATAVAAAATRLASEHGCSITILEAGRNNQVAIEDSLAAGAIYRAMTGVHLRGPALPDSGTFEADFFASESGRNLKKLGYGADVRFCAGIDRYSIVPVLRDGVLVPTAGESL